MYPSTMHYSHKPHPVHLFTMTMILMLQLKSVNKIILTCHKYLTSYESTIHAFILHVVH